MENGKLNLLVSFVGGSILGAGFALLLAPQSGKKTRRDVARMGKVGMKKCKSLQHDVRDTVENFVEELGEKIDDSLTQGKVWTQKTLSQVQQAVDPRVH